MKHPNTFFLGGLLCAAFFVTACDSKVAECNKVADIVNAGAKDMATLDSAMAKDAGDGAKTVRAVADAAKKTKTDIEALTIKTEELKPKVAAYVALMDDFVTQTTTFADLLAQSSAADDETTQKAFESAQDALVQACSTESPDCTKVGEVMEKQPDQVADDKFPGMLEQYAKDLGALSLEHETTKAAVTKLKAATEAYAKFAQDVATNQAKLADAGKQLDELGAKEDTVVDDLNGYCLGTAK